MSGLSAYASKSRWTFTQELGEPRFVLELLVQDGQSQVVGTVILTCCHVADCGVALDRAALSIDQHREHGLNFRWVLRQVGRWAGRNVVEVVHVARQRAAQLVDAWNQRLEVVAILDTCILGNSLDSLTLQANQIDPLMV